MRYSLFHRFRDTTSPEFNMDKVDAPLQVVASGRFSLLTMWGAYAALRIRNKPVDLIMLRGGTHIMTNPAERLASQMGTIDWMRYWLQNYEDPDPNKAKQYARWGELRKLQEADRSQHAKESGAAPLAR